MSKGERQGGSDGGGECMGNIYIYVCVLILVYTSY